MKCVDMVVILSCVLVCGCFVLFSPLRLLLTSHREEKISEKYLQWFFPLHSGLSPPVAGFLADLPEKGYY